MELLRGWTIFRHRWPIVLACLVVAVVWATIYCASADRQYTASTELFLRAPDVKTSAGAYQGDLFSRQRAQTYVKMFDSDDLAQMVIDKLGLTVTPQQLVSHVSASTVKNTVLMVVSVTDSNAQHAANIANGYGAVLGTFVARLENVANNPDIPPLVQVVARANPANAEASGSPIWMVFFAAGALALLAATGVIWVLAKLSASCPKPERSALMATSAKHSRIPRNSNRRHCDSASMSSLCCSEYPESKPKSHPSSPLWPAMAEMEALS